MAKKNEQVTASLDALYKKLKQHAEYLKEAVEKVRQGKLEGDPNIVARQFAATYVYIAKMMTLLVPSDKKRFDKERWQLETIFRGIEKLHSKIMGDVPVLDQIDIFVELNKRFAQGLIILGKVLKKAGIIDSEE